MNVRRITRFSTTLALAVVLGAPLAFPQSSEEAPAQPMMHHGMMQGQQGRKAPGDMPSKCKQCKMMMQQRQQMMQKCKMMDAKLDELAAAMNTATGPAKIDAMTALLNELVQQRKAMHAMMMDMSGGMMGGMKGMHEGMMERTEGGDKPKCKMMQKMMPQQGEAPARAGAQGSGS